ncbi:unnamed protein product [Moneuplotes crassus]|uniref:Uncharacterized protein n=1 Tax=Euplotes crassus TaxID=5936 RepID=A0AAD1Y4B2_EUPCR|nr:unnamed protein product [Moneuplotes crassus]
MKIQPTEPVLMKKRKLTQKQINTCKMPLRGCAERLEDSVITQIFRKNKYKTNHNSSVTSQTSESAYATNTDKKNFLDISLTSEGDASIEQLQKQQEELQKMQNMIQQKMSTLQTAINSRAHKGGQRLCSRSRTIIKDAAMYEDEPNEKPPVPQKMEDMAMTISDYTSQPITEAMTQSMVQNSGEKFNEEDSVPLEPMSRPSSSLHKSRRSRKDRYNEKSQDRINFDSLYRKSEKKSLIGAIPENKNLNSATKPTQHKILTKSGSNMCSKVRPSKFVEKESTLHIPKCIQVEKAATLINKRTLNALKKIRPIQSSIQVIRGFVKILKFYNPKIKNFNEEDTWMRVCFSLIHNSNTVLREIKLLSLKCTTYPEMPKVLELIANKILGKKEKNVPACSSSFQKECQPFTRLLQSLVNYYKSKQRTERSKSNHSAIRTNRSSASKKLSTPTGKKLKASKKKDSISPSIDSEQKQHELRRKRIQDQHNFKNKTTTDLFSMILNTEGEAETPSFLKSNRRSINNICMSEKKKLEKENTKTHRRFNTTQKLPNKKEITQSCINLRTCEVETPQKQPEKFLSPQKMQRTPASMHKDLSNRLSRPLLNTLNLGVFNISETEEEGREDDSSSQQIPSNIIEKIAKRHLARRNNGIIGKSRDKAKKASKEEHSLSFGATNPSNQNIFHDDLNDSNSTPRKEALMQETHPDKLNMKISKNCEANMFEQNQSETSEEEEPRQLKDSFINLDTQRGQAELYEEQASFDESPPVCEHKDYVIIKPQTDERRMIALPKNNEPVNISEMLSRSFIFDNPSDLNMSINTDRFMMEGASECKEIDFNPHNRLNISTDFGRYTHLKHSDQKAYNPFKDRQKSVLEAMEKEHLKIETLKSRRTSA